MRIHRVTLCCLLCACGPGKADGAEILPREGVLWRETQGLEQLEFRWRLLQGGEPGPGTSGPVTAGGPVESDSFRPGIRAGEPTPPDSQDPLLRFDLAAAGLAQGGQTGGPFLDEQPFSPRDLPDPDLRMRVGAGLFVRLSPHWSFWQRTVVDSDPALDPASRTKEFHQIDASVEVPEAALAYQREELTAWIGRRWERWGPGWTGSLILEPGAPAPDGFGYSWTRSRWALRYRFGRLDDFLKDGTPVSRFQAGHRLDFSATGKLRLGLSETTLTSSRNSAPLWLMNPLLPWSLTQSEDRGPAERSNILWSLDAIWNPTAAWALYGQFLLDDFMIDGVDRDTHPDQLGFLAGLLWTPGRSADSAGSTGRWRLGLEYSRLGSWTYVHRDPELRYRAWNAGLGHPAGPDSESATLVGSRSGLPFSATALLWARWHRQGQVWLDTPLGPVGSAGLPWPTPPVSRWWQLGTTLQAGPLAGWTTTLRGGWSAFRPGLGGPGLPPGPARAGHGFWASLTLSLPLLKFETGL